MGKYAHFSHVYDRFMQDAPYDRWVSFTEEICKERKFVPESVIDLGCGTGEIAIRLAQKGYDVIGIDLSTEMLTLADQKSRNQSLPVSWVQQDLREMEGIHEADLAISYCDVMNYITEPDELKKVIINVYNSLNDGGWFIFDVHSLQYAKQYLMDNTFSDVDDEMAYVWNCFSGDREGELFHELTFFLEQEEGTYERFDEDHHQRVFESSFYVELLREANFTNIKIYGDFQLKNEIYDQMNERIFIVAQKQSR